MSEKGGGKKKIFFREREARNILLSLREVAWPNRLNSKGEREACKGKKGGAAEGKLWGEKISSSQRKQRFTPTEARYDSL